jgi:hypothetical protein
MGGCVGSLGRSTPNPKQVDASHFKFQNIVGKGGFAEVQ